MENNALSRREVLLFRTSLLTLIFLLGCIYQYFSFGYNYSLENFFIIFIPGAIGAALTMGIIPGIIAIIRKFKKKPPTKKNYFVYFSIVVVFFLLAFSSVISRLEYQRTATHYNNDSIHKEQTFKFANKDFKVYFKSKPKIVEISSLVNGKVINGQQAELVVVNDKSLCRAECFNYEKHMVGNVNKEAVSKYLLQFANDTGLSFPVFDYEENDFGKVETIRGYKSIANNTGGKVRFTFTAKAYYGNKSAMILSVGCPSEDYPTLTISKFLNSISKV